MQNFRHFWFNVQGITLGGLAPTLRQIASICKKAEEAQWNGLSEVRPQFWPQVNRFGARGQNVLVSSTIFQTLSFLQKLPSYLPYSNEFDIIVFFFRWDELSDTQFRPKKKLISKFDLPSYLESQVRSGQSWSYWASFDSGPQNIHFGTHFIRLSPLVQKLWAIE